MGLVNTVAVTNVTKVVKKRSLFIDDLTIYCTLTPYTRVKDGEFYGGHDLQSDNSDNSFSDNQLSDNPLSDNPHLSFGSCM